MKVANFQIPFGAGGFFETLEAHLRAHPGHKLVTLMTLPAEEDQPARLLGVTRQLDQEPYQDRPNKEI